LAIVAGRAGAGSLVLRRLLTCVLAGFMMADNTTGTRTQHAVVTREVARHAANRRTLETTGRVCPRRHYARRQCKSQTRGHQIPFHRFSLISAVNALWVKQTEQENIP
jgi:hypothetical protein